MQIRWQKGFRIHTATRGQEITISANKEGMVSLANILLELSDGRPGDHIHLDEYNSLEEGSAELVIERIP